MSSRKYHQKSRNGCSQCKRRRVKCDEGRPSCRNCQRTQATCTYATNNDTSPPGGSDGNASSPQLRNAPHNAPLSFDLLDLRLMHHYTLIASLELFPDGNAQAVWQNTIPLEAHSHPILMHGLLAISAAHLTLSQKPKDGADYWIRAVHHQNQGLLEFRAAISNITKENAVASFIFSIMLGIMTYLCPHLTDRAANIDDALDVFTFMRGSKVIWELEKETVFASPMAILIPRPDWEYDKLDFRVETQLDSLKEFPDEDMVYASAIDMLKLCLQVAIAKPRDHLVISRWVATVSDAYWAKARAHEPIALLIMAHFSLVLSTYRPIWWLGNWNTEIIRTVGETLSESDKEVVSWQARVDFLLQYSNNHIAR